MQTMARKKHIHLEAIKAAGKVWLKRLHGQAVKTSPFHGGNTGSIPVGVIKIDKSQKAPKGYADL